MSEVYRESRVKLARIPPHRLLLLLSSFHAERAAAKVRGESHGNFGEDFEAACLDLRDCRVAYSAIRGAAFDMHSVLDEVWQDMGGCTAESPDDAPPCNDCIPCRARLAIDQYLRAVKENEAAK